MIQQRARAHYAAAAASTPGADPAEYRARADRQTRETLRFVPRYYSTAAIQLLALASIAGAIRCASLSPMRASAFLFVIVLADLWGFGLGLNPAIPSESYETRPPILSILSEVPGARILALGDEWPPNTAMRFGISDVRNYDSIEVARYFDWFEPIYEPNSRGSRTSRREITWKRVERSVDRLIAAGVCRVISPAPPPPGTFDRVREIDGVWVVDLPGDPVVSLPPAVASPGSYLWTTRELERLAPGEKIVVREIAMPGWRAEVNGRRIEIETNGDPFMKIPIDGRPRRVELRYAPIEVEIGVWTSCSALIIAVFALTLPPEFRSTRIVGARLGRNHAAGVVS
jgi:hypothetical protein